MSKELKIEVTYLDLATALEEALERTPTPEEIKEFFEYIGIDVGSWINDNARSFITKRTEEGRPLG
jgi:Ca2+-binding EF-hand superfamily protein